MKKFLLLAFSLISIAFSQTTPLSFTHLSTDFLRPGAGVMNWNDDYVVAVPSGGSTGIYAGVDRYFRLAWTQVENDDSSFTWTQFDVRAQIAIDHGQKFSFSVMPYCEGCSGSSVGGGNLTYPGTLHTQMQAETQKDYKGTTDNTWVPNVNSPNYLRRWKRLLNAVASHINSTVYNGVHYSNAVLFVDIRGYGNFGEWHNYPYDLEGGWPSALWPLQASLDSIIEYHLEAFPNYPAVTLIGSFASGGDSHVPLECTYRLLTESNNWGRIGWRRDNWGDATNYTSILENNPNSYNSLTFKTVIMDAYKTGIITGEPLNGLTDYSDLDVEVKKYGAASFGNGNLGNPSDAGTISNVQTASKDAGYRLQFLSGSISSTISPGNTFSVSLNWQNIGVAPSYENWETDIELRSGATVVQSWTSSFQPELFLPSGSATTVTDDLLLSGSVSTGSYSLYLIIRDPNGYRDPLPLSITGRQTDGSYLIANVSVTTGGGGGGGGGGSSPAGYILRKHRVKHVNKGQ